MNIFRCLWNGLRTPSGKWSVGSLLVVGGVTVLLLFGGAVKLIGVTDTMEFCISCHEMKDTMYPEYQESLHYVNKSGVRAGCPDCHVPKAFGPKLVAKVIAVKDVWHTLIGTVDTPEKFAAKRWEMANRVWRFMERTDSATCRSCHSFTAMELESQARLARRKHKGAVEENQTCVECHRGVAHEVPDPPEESVADNS